MYRDAQSCATGKGCDEKRDLCGNLYVADEANDTSRKIEIATRRITTVAGKANSRGWEGGIGVHARFAAPSAVAYDPSGVLYVADTSNHAIRKIVLATGEVSTLAGTSYSGTSDGKGTEAAFGTPWAVVSDGQGNLYVTDSAIRRIDSASGTVNTIAGGLMARR